MNPDLIAIVGPTASGKTALALDAAEALQTEIVSADSMQFYRGMEIGSGAPTADELARVGHHFIGFVEPSEKMSAGRFEALARPVVERLNAAGKIAVVVGGSGLYVRALIDGLIDAPEAVAAVRADLAERAETEGVASLYAELAAIDPPYAATIGDRDLRRIVRALEVYAMTGKPFSEHHARQAPPSLPFRARQVAIDWPRAELYARIDARVDAMMEAGFLDEVRRLLDAGYEADLVRLRAVGYRELIAHLRGQTSLDEAVEQIKQQTRRLAKRQLTWFRADDRIEWIATQQRGDWISGVVQRLGVGRV